MERKRKKGKGTEEGELEPDFDSVAYSVRGGNFVLSG